MKQDEWMKLIGKIDPAYIEEAEQWKKMKKKHLLIKRILPMAACICILLTGAAAGVDYLRGAGMSETVSDCAAPMPESAAATAESAVEEDAAENAAAEDTFTDQNAEKTPEVGTAGVQTSGEKDQDKEKISVNNITEMTAYCIDVDADHFEQISLEEFEAYCGMPVLLQKIPEDLALETESAEIAYSRKNEVVVDNNDIVYQDATGSRRITVTVRTVESGTVEKFTEEESMKPSEIGGIKVLIGYTEESGSYMAIFTKANVTFNVSTQGLSEEEMLDVLRQLC